MHLVSLAVSKPPPVPCLSHGDSPFYCPRASFRPHPRSSVKDMTVPGLRSTTDSAAVSAISQTSQCSADDSRPPQILCTCRHCMCTGDSDSYSRTQHSFHRGQTGDDGMQPAAGERPCIEWQGMRGCSCDNGRIASCGRLVGCRLSEPHRSRLLFVKGEIPAVAHSGAGQHAHCWCVGDGHEPPNRGRLAWRARRGGGGKSSEWGNLGAAPRG